MSIGLGSGRSETNGQLPLLNAAGTDFRTTPEKYTTIDQLKKATKDFVMPDLVETYGNQGITGFLELTGAVRSGGTSDQIDWWEVGRRHTTVAYDADNVSDTGSGVSVTIDSADTACSELQANDVVMDKDTGVRFIVQSGGFGSGTAADVILVKLDGTVTDVSTDLNVETDGELIVLGNMYPQGSNQPTAYRETDIRRLSNPFMIVKGRHEVNGSQATNLGWVNFGGGDYRWFMYAEQEARKRFQDQRELMLLFGEKHDGTGGTALTDDLAGSDGYFTQVESRGITITGATDAMDFATFDLLIGELDKQGAPSEYAMYVNRKQDLGIDDMLAAGPISGNSVTTGLPGQYGAFNNDADLAVKLGFKSFTRGGYTFHKHDWKLLNDPTLVGASTKFAGAMVPLANVTDARSGMTAPALSMYYKEANGYSRELEHWVTGGGVLGYNNNGDTGADQAVFHYRSEIALCVRAANQHVVLKG